ncbi:MAG: dTDP-4-dehydrorhamnose 3,5-epimerase family protein [Pseudomonadota bacterium]
MKLTETTIRGVAIAETTSRGDHRGVFTRLYCERELEPAVGQRRIAQINRSVTRAAGAVRGMHYQNPPHAEMKLVRCLRGRVWDVAVDLRAGSPTFLKWTAQELSADNNLMFMIPEGCAHGFQVLEENSELLYLHTEFYAAGAEAGFSPSDPAVGISWPLPIIDLSERDRSHPSLTTAFTGIVV